MSTNKQIVSVFVILIIMLTSILQYHHHDILGNVCLYAAQSSNHCCDIDINTQNNDNHPLTASHGCSGSNHSHNSDDSNCGMKLSNTNTVKQHSISGFQFCFILLNTLRITIIPTVSKADNSAILYSYGRVILPSLHSHTVGLRAPPAL